MDKDVLLSPSQGQRLMALAVALREGDLCFRGHEEEDEQSATDLIRDVGEEIALQFGGGWKLVPDE